MIVADTNTIVYLLTPPVSAAENARAVLQIDPSWYAPPLWRSEFRNVMWVMVRRGSLSFEQALRLLDEADFIVTDFDAGVSSQAILRLAVEANCSPYDCEFVALARELHCSLVTSDRALQKAFPCLAVAASEFVRTKTGR